MITRKYSISYQLGATGSTHSKLSAAIRALQSARNAARRGGDCQGITITVTEYRDGQIYGTGELTDAERNEIEIATR